MATRLTLGLATLVFLAAASFAGSVVDIETSSAGSTVTLPIVNERALVIAYDSTNRCALFDGDGNLVFGEGGISVITSSANGAMMTRCRAGGLANSTGSAVVFTSENNPFGPGTKCGILTPTGLCFTDTWTNTISASGQGTVVCHFRNASCE